MRLSFSSVRLRLTLWSVLVLAVALLAYGALLRYQVQRDIVRGIDVDLTRFARWIDANPPLPQPFPPEAHFERRPNNGPGADGNRPGRNGPTNGAPPRMGRRRTQPRFFTVEGKPKYSDSPDEARPWDPATFPLSARHGRQVFSTITVAAAAADDERMRVLSFPLHDEQGRINGVLQAARPLTEVEWVIGQLTRTLLTFVPFSLLIAAVGGAFLTSRALRPVRHITQAAGRIEAQDLSLRLPVAGGDEFAHLAATFNGLLERLERAFEQQRRFTADASHELRTPLAGIKVNTSLALRGERTPEQYRQTLRTVDRATDTATRIVQDLLLLARSDSRGLDLRRIPTPVSDVLLSAIQGVETVLPGPNGTSPPTAPITITVSEPALTVLGDAHHLVRLFTNLLENAVRHTPPHGRICVTASALNDQVTVDVADTGEGIAPDHLAHVCERFFRSDDSRTRASGGTGLGLAICKSIVEAHGGRLVVESAVGQGTRVRVTLPRAAVVGSEAAPATKQSVETGDFSPRGA